MSDHRVRALPRAHNLLRWEDWSLNEEDVEELIKSVTSVTAKYKPNREPYKDALHLNTPT
jgi:hypothetical protein